MKWFKHMTCANRDEKLARLRDEGGFEAYGFYWFILEVVAEHMDETSRTWVDFPIGHWRRMTGFSVPKLHKLLMTCQSFGLIVAKSSDKSIKVDIPNLLKIRDNHTKNLQVAYKQEVEVEVDKECCDAKAHARAQEKIPKNEKLKTDFEKIYEAGCALFPNLAPADTSPIHIWLKSGCDPCDDCIATIRRFEGKNITTWKYFTNAIADAKATRLTPMPEGKPHANHRNNPAPNSRETSFNALFSAGTGHQRSEYEASDKPLQRGYSGGITGGGKKAAIEALPCQP